MLLGNSVWEVMRRSAFEHAWRCQQALRHASEAQSQVGRDVHIHVAVVEIELLCGILRGAKLNKATGAEPEKKEDGNGTR